MSWQLLAVNNFRKRSMLGVYQGSECRGVYQRLCISLIQEYLDIKILFLGKCPWSMYFRLYPANIYLFKVSHRNTRKKLWNIFEVNNKNTRTFFCYYCWLQYRKLLVKVLNHFFVPELKFNLQLSGLKRGGRKSSL